MIGLYNIVCFLISMIPMLAFIAAAVVSMLHGHPYFAGAFAVMAMLTIPKIQIGDWKKEDKKEEEKKDDALELNGGRDKYHLVREIGKLADENHVDKEVVFRMIRENNAIRGSRYWYGMGPCSDFFNNKLQKYVRYHHGDWRKFTDEFCRQLKEMDKENKDDGQGGV